jgi:site-specific DNA recombinase
VDALVWEDVCRLLNEPEAIRFALERAHGGHWLPQDLQARRQALRRGQAGVQQQLERLTEAYLANIVGLEEYRRRRLDLEQKAQSLAAQVQQLEAQADRHGEVARVALSIEEFCRRVREGLDQATWEQKRQLIECLVVRVIVTDGEVEIRYAIPTSPAGEATRFCQLRADYRAALGKAERMEGCCHTLREDRLILHGHPLPRRYMRLDQAMTGPSTTLALSSLS